MNAKLVGFAAAALLALPAAAQRIAVNPSVPAYGQEVTIAIEGASGPVFLPATRYARAGSTIYVDYEFIGGAQGFSQGFGPTPPSGASAPISIGELPAGFYNVEARLIDVARPNSAASIVSTTLSVAAPQEWGVYPVPREPMAYSKSFVTLRSAVYFDQNSMRTTLEGNVVKLEFVYKDDAPAIGVTPPGMTLTASAPMPTLAPGAYRLEGWGRKFSGGPSERYFSRDFTVASNVEVVEYYSAGLDHYFMSAGTDEIALLDRGGDGDWKRTGQSMLAWARLSDAPPGASPVCRFYAAGPNSHFYTGSAQECDYLKTLERDQRARAAAAGKPFLGWAFETIAFYAVMPENGRCPGTMKPVYRSYNNRAAQMDSNHRFTTDTLQRDSMTGSWGYEGVVFCSA